MKPISKIKRKLKKAREKKRSDSKVEKEEKDDHKEREEKKVESEGRKEDDFEKIHLEFGEVSEGGIEEEKEDLKNIDRTYPLINMKSGSKEFQMATAHITWNQKTSSLIYEVEEPTLEKKEKEKLEQIKEIIKKKLDIPIGEIRKGEAFKYMVKRLDEAMKELGYNPTDVKRARIEYFIYRDLIGLGRIEPLMHDPNIEDISCDGKDIPVFIYHRNPSYGRMRTNIIFKEKDKLDNFAFRLAQKIGKGLSIAEPIVDGSLPDGSRVHITYGIDIARKGSNFSIRKFTKKPLTPTHLMNYETVTPEVFAYLWMAIENKSSVLVSGPTAVGKTTFLNSISLFIKPEFKIVSIEDTPELRLPHPNWIPEVARSGFGGEKSGDVTMFNLLKASMRQRPDYIIVGEVRGKEAFVMFQAMATGHPGLATMHADTMNRVMSRLTTKPIGLPKSLLSNLDILVFLTRQRRKGKYIRRVKKIVEIVNYKYESDSLVTNEVFSWDPSTDEIKVKDSILINKIREKMGHTQEDLKRDLSRRAKVLRWLKEKNITSYDSISSTINMYYNNPKEALKYTEEEE